MKEIRYPYPFFSALPLLPSLSYSNSLSLPLSLSFPPFIPRSYLPFSLVVMLKRLGETSKRRRSCVSRSLLST